MITREDAEQTAAAWARAQSRQAGFELTPRVHEFDLGFIVWSQAPESTFPEPGSGARTVIDRDSAVMTYYPALPNEQVEQRYRADVSTRLRVPATVDLAAELRRENSRPVTPSVAAHLTLPDGKLRRAFGAKSDAPVNHHPLVREWLAAQPPGTLVRGVERHAELIVVSDALHERDAQALVRGEEPLTLDDARAIFARRRFEGFMVRDAGDLDGGEPISGCVSCVAAYVHYGLLPAGAEAPDEYQVDQVRRFTLPDPDRFPADVGEILGRSGWVAQLRAASEQAADRLIGWLTEAGHVSHDAGRRACADYGYVVCDVDRPGSEVRTQPFSFGPRYVEGTAAALAAFGQLIGAELFPLGREGQRNVMAIDETGRVFVLDQAGDWFIGETMEAALINLLQGTNQLRVREDGAW